MRPAFAAVVFVATILAVSMPASAAPAEVFDICQSDRERVCIGAEARGTGAIHCLSRRWSELTASCRNAMRDWNAAAVRKTGGPQHPWRPKPKNGKADRKGQQGGPRQGGPRRGD